MEVESIETAPKNHTYGGGGVMLVARGGGGGGVMLLLLKTLKYSVIGRSVRRTFLKKRTKIETLRNLVQQTKTNRSTKLKNVRSKQIREYIYQIFCFQLKNVSHDQREREREGELVLSV